MIVFGNADALCLDKAIDANTEDINDIFNNSLLGGARCQAGGCSSQLTPFRCLEESELHYSLCHRFACEACRQAFPNQRLLDCHIEAAHSGPLCKMFSCVLPVCDEKFASPTAAKEHAIKDHKFVASFRFFPPTKESPTSRQQDAIRKRPPMSFPRVSSTRHSGDKKSTGMEQGDDIRQSATEAITEPMETE